MASSQIFSFLSDLQNQGVTDDMTRKGFSYLTSVTFFSFLHCYLLSLLSSFLPFLQNPFHLNTASLLTHCAWYHYSGSTYYFWTSIFFLHNHMQPLSFSITQPTFLLYLPWSINCTMNTAWSVHQVPTYLNSMIYPGPCQSPLGIFTNLK